MNKSIAPVRKANPLKTLAGIGFALALLGHSGHAANPATTNTWNVGTGNWNTGADWLPTGVPASGASNVFEFDAAGTTTYTSTNNIAANYQVNGLRFNNSGTGNIGVTSAAADSIQLISNGAQLPFIEMDGAGNVTLGGAVILGANTTVNGTGTGTITATGTWSGAFSLTMSGAGTLALSGTNNSFSSLVINSGVVSGAGTASFGSGAITLGSGSGSTSATLLTTGAVTQANGITVASGGSGVLTIEGSGVTNTYSGAVALNNNLTVDNLTSGKVTTFSNTVTETSSGSPALTITKGTGTGSVTISGGIVLGSGGLTLANSGAGVFTSSGGISGTGALTLQNNGSTINGLVVSGSSGINNVGTLTIGGSGSGSTAVSAAIGSNVTNVLVNASGGNVTISGAVGNTGNLTFSGTGTSTVAVGTGTITSAGLITNNGTTSGATTISGVIASGVTGVVQDSATSELILSGSNTFTTGVKVNQGTLLLSQSRGAGAGTGGITLGATGGSSAASLLSNTNTVSVANAITLGTTTGSLTLGNNGGTTSALFSGGVAMGSNNLYFTASGTGTVTESGALTGSGTLYINGTGVAVLSGASSGFSGNTVLSSGILYINNATALGVGGTLSISAGTSIDNTVTNNLTIANAENWNGSFTYLGQSWPTTLSGAINMPSALTLTVAQNSLTVSGTITGSTNGVFDLTKAGSGTLIYSPAVTMAGNETVAVTGGLEIFNGVISGSGDSLTKTGSGTLVLNATNTYSGGTIINGGAVQVGNGSSTGGFNGTSTITNNATLIYNHNNNFTESDAITGSGTVIGGGTGTVTFTSTANWTGGTTINSGVLAFSSSSAPGSPILINTAGSLNSGGAFTGVSGWLASGDINANSTGDIGLTGNSSENINFTGYNNLMLGATVTSTYTGVLTAANSTYRLGGGSATLTLSNTNALTGANALVVGASNSTGTTTNTVALTGANNMTGGTSVVAGTLDLAGAAGALTTSTITVNNGATLLFDSSTAGVTGTTRAAGVILNGAGASALNVKGNATANSNDVITGALSIGAGASGSGVVTLTGSTDNTELTAGSLAISPGSLVLFRGTNLGSAFGTAGATDIAFTTAPTLTGGGGTPGTGSPLTGIIVGAFGDTNAAGTGGSAGAGGLLTYDPADGVRLLTSSEYATSITSGATTLNNVLLNTTSGALSTSITSNTTINSLSLTESGAAGAGQSITLSGSAGTVLTINSGMIFDSQTVTSATNSTGSQAISVPFLNFGGNTGYLITGQTNGISNGFFSGGLTISSVIEGSNGLVVGGGGYTQFTGVNTYTGTTYVDLVGAGRLILSTAGGTSSASSNAIPGDLVLNSGTVVGNSNYVLGNGTNFTINGGTYTGQNGNSGQASFQSYASLTMNGGQYSIGSGGHGGGFALTGALTMNGGNISQPNTAAITVNGLTTFAGGTINIAQSGSATAYTTYDYYLGGLAISNTASGSYTPITISAGSLNALGGQVVIGSGGSSSVTFTGNSTNANTVTIAAPTGGGPQGIVALNGSVTFNIGHGSALASGTADLTIAAPITDDPNTGGTIGSLVKTGLGTLLLTGSNTYTGGTTLSSGTLAVSGAGTLGAAGIAAQNGLSISGGVLDLGGTTQNVDTLSVTGASTIQNGNLEADDIFGGQVFAFSNSTGTVQVSANLLDSADPVPLTKTGAGVLNLSGSNTYSGGTTVSGGTVLLSNTHGSATGTGSLTVGAGATLGGYGSSSGQNFSIAGTGTTTSARANVLVGLNSLADTNTVHTLTLTASSASTIADVNLTFNLDAKSTASTQLNVGNTAIAFGTDAGSVQFTLNLQNEPAIVGSYTTYTLIAGTSSGNQYSGLTLGSTINLGNGATETIITGNNLQLAFGSAVDQSFYGAHSYLVLYQAAGVDDIDVVVVPEPGTWALMIGGLGVLLFWQRRRKNS